MQALTDFGSSNPPSQARTHMAPNIDLRMAHHESENQDFLGRRRKKLGSNPAHKDKAIRQRILKRGASFAVDQPECRRVNILMHEAKDNG